MNWIAKNSDAIAYIKLSLADEQALQFAAEDNAKVLWIKLERLTSAKLRTVIIETRTLQVQAKETIRLEMDTESNGKAERANRVLLERARSLLYEIKLPLKFWAEAIKCSTQVSNVTPRKGKEKIPLEIWTDHVITSNRQNQIPVLELNDVQNQIPVRRSERLKSKLMSVHLVNNVPNSYFEAENSANWKN
ncbi:retrovirus-related Pol polyprotein from transposon TNT 1-94 [Trichonephila clavipes]|nr:retrovirus-related Pol polyprotein from transposon TNT 1-94 [Trichonephila clavipes]